MRFRWGATKLYDTEKMDQVELARFIDWVDTQDFRTPKSAEYYAKARTAASRELERQKQVDEEEVEDYKLPTARSLYVAFCQLRAKQRTDLFKAPGKELSRLSGIKSKTTIAQAKSALKQLKLLAEPTEGEYRLLPEGSKFGLGDGFVFSLSVIGKEGVLQETPSSISGPTAQELNDCLFRCAEILRTKKRDDVIRYSRARLNALLKEKHTTLDDVVKVATWAREAYDTGENRYAPLLDLYYILEPRRFTGYLAAANTTRLPRKAVGLLEPDVAERWRQDRLSKLRTEEKA